MNAAVKFDIANSLSVGSATLRERVLVAAMNMDVQTSADLHAQQRIMNRIAQDSLAAAILLQQKDTLEKQARAKALADAKAILGKVNAMIAGKMKGAMASRALSDMNTLRSTSAGKAQARGAIVQEYNNTGKIWN